MPRRYFVVQCDQDSIAATVLGMACKRPPFGEVIVTEVEPAIWKASTNEAAIAAKMIEGAAMTREQAEQIAQCVQCQKAAYVVFSWTGSVGPQRAPLCQSCAKKFHDTYKHTPVWASVTLGTP